MRRFNLVVPETMKVVWLPFVLFSIGFFIAQILNYWTSWSAGIDLFANAFAANMYASVVVLVSLGAFSELFIARHRKVNTTALDVVTLVAWGFVTIFDNVLTYWTYAVLIESNNTTFPQMLSGYIIVFPIALAIVQAAMEFFTFFRIAGYVKAFSSSSPNTQHSKPKSSRSESRHSKQYQEHYRAPKYMPRSFGDGGP